MAQWDNLNKKCELLGLTPAKSRNRVNKETGERYKESTIDDFIKALQTYYIDLYKKEGTLNPFVEIILKHPPMLAAQMKSVKPEVQKELWIDNNDWIATEKIDGNRMRYCYDENYGVEYFSRNLSEGTQGDYLPIAYSDIISIPRPNTEVLKQAGINRFIVDCELVPLYDDIKEFRNYRKIDGEIREVMEFPVADTGLSLTTGILGSLPDLAHRMQETNPLKLVVFDAIELNGEDLSNLTFRERLKKMVIILSALRNTGVGFQVQAVKSSFNNKEKFYRDILAKGGEGCVIKDLTSKYTGKRDGSWVKAKRTVSGSILQEESGDNIDAFVIGFKKGNDGTNIENLVGALDFGTYLLDDAGEYITNEMGMPIIHHIATIAGLTLEEREAMTEIVNGEVRLKMQYYNKVAEIDGQDVSSKNLRLAHARLIRWRPDRSSDTCQIKKSFIEKLVL